MPFPPMSLSRKLARMIMVDIPGTTLSASERALLADPAWGGVILFARNCADRVQLAGLCADLHAAAGDQALLVGIDQEGGSVNRFAFPESPMSPGNMALAATGSTEMAREAARLVGADLCELGFNLNFAPCVDTNCNPLNPIIGVRSFGEDPRMVARFGVAAAQGYREGGVIPTAKHFPGHGDTSLDTHLALAVVRHERERLDRVELHPFRVLVENGIEVIMTAHIVYPALSGDEALPATLSPRILTGFLRDEWGFDGVIITDSMAMHAIARRFGTGEAAVMAVEAGADIVLACGTHESQLETHAALLQAAQEGRLTEERIDASLSRLARLHGQIARYRKAAEPLPADARERMLAITRAGITVVRDERAILPLLRPGGPRPHADQPPVPPSSHACRRLLLAAPSHVSRSPHGELGVPFPLARLLRHRGFEVDERLFSLLEPTFDVAGTVAAAEAAEAIVVCLHARDRLSTEQEALVNGLCATGRPVVAVAINSPYVLAQVPAGAACVCTYSYTEVSMQALGDVLAGLTPPTGQLPVS